MSTSTVSGASVADDDDSNADDDDDDHRAPEVSYHEMSDEANSANEGEYFRPQNVEIPDNVRAYYDAANKSPLKPNDDEHFTLDDNTVRRIIYNSCKGSIARDHRAKLRRVICVNFTRQHFEPGATKWHHLKAHYYELLMSILNSLAFATGKKVKLTPSEKAVREKEKQGGRKRGGKRKNGDDDSDEEDAVAAAEAVEKTPEIEMNNFLQGNKELSVYVETLVSCNKVAGYRWWIFDYSTLKTPNDILSLGLRESLLEAARIQEQEKKEMQVILKSNSSARSQKAKKAAASKQYSLSKEFSFSAYPTFDRHFTGLIKRYFGYDSCLAVSDNECKTGKAAARRQFKDSRPYTKFNTVVQEEGQSNDYTLETHPCNLSNLLSKEQAMFYYVNEENIQEEQCRLESYFHNANGGRIAQAKESEHSSINLAAMDGRRPTAPTPKKRNTPAVMDIADYANAAKDNAFKSFPFESITYAIDNTFIAHEFISRMPLPHRIGATLYTQKDIVSLKRHLGMPISQIEQAEADTEEVQSGDIGNFLDNLVISDHSGEEEYGMYGLAPSKQNPLNYGTAVVRYMGLHHTEQELTTDILLSQMHHVDQAAHQYLKQPVVPSDVLDKFRANKRNEINARLRLILTNLGPKGRTVVCESLSACISAQEDTRNKSSGTVASSVSSLIGGIKAGSDGRDQTVSIMDQIGHRDTVDEKDPNLLLLPYVSMTPAILLNNREKKLSILRKAAEYRRRLCDGQDEDENGLALDPEARIAQIKHLDAEYQSKLASGKVQYYKDTIEKWRPYGNSLYTLKTQLQSTDVEEVFLGRDIFLRLAELNAVAYANLDLHFFDPVTGLLLKQNEDAYFTARRELRDALAVECWHEFFENRSVSLACDGIRSDLLKQKISYAPPESVSGNQGISADSISTHRLIGTELPVHISRQELRPYGEFRTWVNSLFADQFGIAYNYKIMWLLYVGRLHHCRWHPDCNSPKHNIILSGTGMAGKSHMLQAIKKILPTGVGDMVTHITDQAFNVDRNMNDMLLIYEEFQNKFLGYSSGGSKNGSDGGGGGGVSAGSDKDTTNFFKARLTSGATTTMSWFENEETGMRDMKISKAHCQGSIMGASNNNFTDADANVMSRFILLSVPKSKAHHEGNRPQDKTKFVFGTDSPQDKAIYEQHKEIHRVYFMVEQMIKSNVLGENVYGVNVDGGRIMRDLILDHLQKRYGLSTGDVRKRDHILEMARSMALSYAVWMGLTSPLTRYLQYDPHDEEKFIGFNPRVITEGILPFMVITKDMIFDAITSLSSLWYHDYQDLILEVFATKHCKLHELRESDFLMRSKNDNFFINLNAVQSNNKSTKRAGTASLNTSMNNIPNSSIGNAYGAGGNGHGLPQDEIETDYNYICMRGKEIKMIYALLSNSTGDMVVSENDIAKLFSDLGKSNLENSDGYDMLKETQEGIDEETGRAFTEVRRLVRSSLKKNTSRPVVEFGRCPQTGKQYVAVSIEFLKQKRPDLFSDEKIEDLNKNKRRIVTVEDLNNDMGDMQIDADNENNGFDEKVRRIGKISTREETLIIKSFKDVMENMVLENIGMDDEDRIELEQAYANSSTGQVPWLSYITADPPKPVLITDFYPELEAGLANTDDGNAPILFVDQMKMLDLKPRANGRKIIVRNHNTVSPSTRVTLSIYKDRKKQLVKRTREDGTIAYELGPGEVLKKARIHEYSKTEAWELDQDIDSIFCAEHLRNIAFPGLKSKPDFAMINYPPHTFVALMEDNAEREGTEGVLLEYPFACNLVRIANRKKHAQGLIHPESVKHQKLGVFMRSNFESGAEPTVAPKGIGKKRAASRDLESERRKRQALHEELLC